MRLVRIVLFPNLPQGAAPVLGLGAMDWLFPSCYGTERVSSDSRNFASQGSRIVIIIYYIHIHPSIHPSLPPSIHPSILQSYIHTDRLTDWLTYRQTDIHTDRQTYRLTDWHTDIHTYIYIYIIYLNIYIHITSWYYTHIYIYIFIHMYVCIRSSFIHDNLSLHWKLRVSRTIQGPDLVWQVHANSLWWGVTGGIPAMLDVGFPNFQAKHIPFKAGTTELDVYVERAGMMLDMVSSIWLCKSCRSWAAKTAMTFSWLRRDWAMSTRFMLR